MTQEVNGVPVGSNETTDRGQRLRERSHDEIYLVSQSEMVANAPTLFAKDANTMGLIDHDGAVVLMLQFDDGRQVAEVAFHREYAVYNDEFHWFRIALLQYFLQ